MLRTIHLGSLWRINYTCMTGYIFSCVGENMNWKWAWHVDPDRWENAWTEASVMCVEWLSFPATHCSLHGRCSGTRPCGPASRGEFLCSVCSFSSFQLFIDYVWLLLQVWCRHLTGPTTTWQIVRLFHTLTASWRPERSAWSFILAQSRKIMLRSNRGAAKPLIGYWRLLRF